MRSRPSQVLLFAALSLVLHIAWVWLAPSAPTPPRDRGPAWLDMELEVADRPAPSPIPETVPTESTAVAEPVAATPAHSPSTAAPSSPARASRQPATVRRAAPEPTATPSASPAPVAASTAPAAVAQTTERPIAPNISARAAAISFEAATPSDPLRCNAARGAQDRAACDRAEAEARNGAAQAALSNDLKAVARLVPHLKPRDKPELRARSDGSYGYQGHVFEAVVREDGSVAFADKAVKAQVLSSSAPLTIVADINDVVERDVLGRELYSAEKQWFLDQTRELRGELSARFHAKEQQQARRALERALQEIVDGSATSLQQKHAAIFALWLDCGEDDEARAHRRAVEGFVKRYLPAGSALAFQPEELQQLNAGRRRLQQFSPYPG
jgi:hypothetical protein